MNFKKFGLFAIAFILSIINGLYYANDLGVIGIFMGIGIARTMWFIGGIENV